MVSNKAEIVENSKIAHNIWRMSFISQSIADEYVGAGQFVSILAGDSWEHPIRRPMSIAKVLDDQITIIYKIFGSVTNTLSRLMSGDYIDVLGPLGNTFVVDYNKYTPILVGGGIGLSPILNLSECLNKKGISSHTIIGAKSSDEHFLDLNPNNGTYLSTDDGTIGIKGTVIDVLSIVLKEVENPYIFACGPEGMLSALKLFLNEKGIPGQFSVESYMACGFGFCQGCAIPNNKEGYSLVCKEGPVFDYNEVNLG